ncbi:phosphatidylinositol glycan [Heterostelium album PN500]|uniref:GPI ethanolamine phosphate transferase 1 n=1 Tax=Heterostelium pallidum (strain ATCC 26659 / Pp 5 / PN500) TaxID=670386 RepID=D3B6X8_HETP5|nr:phosphatidylinositol glycan [Heterostelium album PN500]EFA82521.1 phosphatidylinositol glycan [Heterostelium album PN500]|eukprot:XP_020434638.1 phosphatidylinositol glycan [Heterostelium album PN500]
MYHIFSSNIVSIGSGGSGGGNNADSNNHQHHLEMKRKFNSKIMFIVVFGIVFHAVFTLSIFDIYFRSPLVHGMTPHRPDDTIVSPPAKRLVLFVADGLRADKFFEIEEQTGNSRAPFMRDIIEKTGSWGIEDLLRNASVGGDVALEKKLRSDKIVIFLHLLGLDTNGHAYRPNSKEYYDNIKLVDRGIAKITKKIEEFYGDDGKTAFIFTSDHGMSNRGSHGDGERANTETPLVAWGAGVRGPLSYEFQMEKITKLRGKARESLPVDATTPANWKLSHLMRSDVSQADIAPLMTSLIGVPCPLNSVGVLPTDYLGTDQQYTSYALYANTLQIWEMFKLKSDTKKQNSLIFSPFTKLNNAQQMLDSIKWNLDNGHHEETQVLCIAFIELCLQGLNYFQTYDRPFLMAMITLGYFGWIITLSLYVMNNYTIIGSRLDRELIKQKIPSIDKISNYILIVLSIGLYGYLLVNESPILYYIYCTFVIFFWGKTIPSNAMPLYMFMRSYVAKSSHITGSQDISKSGIVKNFIILATTAVLIMELLVVSYFDRRILSILFIVLGISTFTFNITAQLRSYWIIACLAMSVFPMLPVDYGNDNLLVCLGGVLTSGIGLSSLYFSSPNNKGSSTHKKIVYALIATVAFATWIVYSTDKSLERKIGLPYFNQIAAWGLSISSIVVVTLLKGKHYFDHWVYLCLTLAIPFVLFGVSYEILFYAIFIVTLSIWMYTEFTLDSDKASDNITQNDIKRAIIYIFFCYIGFFGVGNIASISSFDLSATYRFTTIFNPFLMGFLLLIKIFIPLLIVALSFSLLNNCLNIPRPASFLVVIALTDIMNINFFFLVKDTGSWLEIGISISHYAISNAFIILQLLLFAVSSALVPAINQSINKIKK